MNDTWSCSKRINVHQRSLALALTGSTQYSESYPSECRVSQRSSMNLQIYIIDRISNKTSLPASLMQTMPHLSHATNRHFLACNVFPTWTTRDLVANASTCINAHWHYGVWHSLRISNSACCRKICASRRTPSTSPGQSWKIHIWVRQSSLKRFFCAEFLFMTLI
jgi:hypothetical protein